MNQEIKKLPDSELEIMLALWRCEFPAHIGDIQKKLSSAKPRQYQAIQTLLGRLVEKKFIRCEKTGRLNYYTPLIDEETYRAQETSSFLDKLYGNSPVRLFAAMVESKRLSPADIAEIKKLLEEGGK